MSSILTHTRGMRLLVVEDQRKMSDFIKKGLSEVGYAVDVAETGAAAESLNALNSYDLIVLDVMLPGQSGLETARHLRSAGFLGPILMLTALSGTKDKVNGLDAGADDYLTKPFSFEELLARIRVLLRQRQPRTPPSALRFADLELDLVNRKVHRSQREISLTPKEFRLLEYFVRNPNRTISRGTIGEQVWGVHLDADSNVIDVYVNMLRKKLEDPSGKPLIHAVADAGYILRDE